MARFYGTLQGNRGAATRCGSSDITTAAQSWDGSIITKLSYNKDNQLQVEIRTSDGSSCYGDLTVFKGTIEEMVKRLTNCKKS